MPNPTLTSARQIVDRDTLQQLFPYIPGQLLDELLRSVDKDLQIPLRVDASSTPNLIVNIGPSVINNTVSNRQKSLFYVGNSIPTFTSGTVTFPSSNGGNIVASTGATLAISCPSNNYVKVLISLDSSGNLQLSQGVFNSVSNSAIVPSPPSGMLPICFVSVFNNAGTIQNIVQGVIFQFGVNNVGSGLISPLTTKGDIWIYTTSNDRLPVGADGTTLTADSTQLTGLAWKYIPSVRFTLSGATIPFTCIDGAHRQSIAQILATISISALDSGNSGSTVIQVNQYRSGSLFNSATASFPAASGNPSSALVALSGSLSLVAGDTITVDVNSIAGGTPSELSVEY